MEFIRKTLIPLLLVSAVVGCSLKKDQPPAEEPKPTVKELKENLFEAILAGEIENVRKILEDDDANPNVYDVDGHTPLMRAVQLRNPIMVGIIIKNEAKIYQPLQTNANVTAFTLITESDTEIKRLFEVEKTRLSTVIEENLRNNKFNDALEFSKENFLPIGLKMPASDKMDLEFALSKAIDSSSVEYLTHLSEGHEAPYVHSLEQQYLLATSQIKNSNFLDYVIRKFPIEEKNDQRLTPFAVFTDLDAENTEWMVSKIEVLNKFEVDIELGEISPQLLSYNKSVTASTTDRDKYIRLLNAVFGIKSEKAEKNLFMQDTLISIADNAKSDLNYLRWIGPVVRAWEAANLGATGFSFDKTASMVVAAIENKDFDIDLAKSVFDDIQAFAPSLENDSEDSIKTIISGKFRQTQKLELLELILAKTHVLPKEIISYAIETGGQESLELILNADIDFESSDQTKAVLSAVQSTNSGVTAYQLLVLLNEHNIPFNSSNGADAVMYAFNKLVIENDLTYSSTLDFLLSISPSPMSNIDKDQALTMLSQILSTSRIRKSGWELLNKIIAKMNTSAFDGSEQYKRVLRIPGVDVEYTVNTSFTWDYILTMFDFFKEDEENLDSMMILLGTVLEKFPNDYFSMSFLGENMSTDPKVFPVQNIFPLSILFSMDKVEITEALKTHGAKESELIYNFRAPIISWSVFAESQIHYHYFQEREFWERVTRAIIKSEKTYFLPMDKASVEFVKILVSSGQLERYPKLAKRLEKLNINLFNHDLKCVLHKGDGQSSSGVTITNNYATGTVDIAGTLGKWTTLGTFEALIGLKDKSCNGTNLSSKEISFIGNYIKKHLGERSAPNNIAINPLSSETPRQTKRCLEVEKPFKYQYGYNYTPIGTALTIPQNGSSSTTGTLDLTDILANIPMLQECVEYGYSGHVHYYAKHFFLNNWYKCASDNNDSSLVEFFESIRDDHGLAPSDSDGGINLCYYN